MSAADPFDRMIEVAEGIRLHVREWSPAEPEGAPVVCLPGLARTVDDFSDLGRFLSTPEGGRRRVVAISARGRGLSDRAADPKTYHLQIESLDALAVLRALSIDAAAFIGTSRGGMQAMMIAALRPEVLRAVVLNDIGPVVDREGLVRIRGYLAPRSAPATWAEAEARLQDVHGAWFPSLDADGWSRWARRAWHEGPHGLEPACDPALVRVFDGIDLDQPLEPLWPLFDALANAPLMVVRGALSDILSVGMLEELEARRPDLATVTVPDQGHAPLLAEPPTMQAIARFLDAAEHP